MFLKCGLIERISGVLGRPIIYPPPRGGGEREKDAIKGLNKVLYVVTCTLYWQNLACVILSNLEDQIS